MKSLFAVLALCLSSVAHGQVQLSTPQTVPLTPPVACAGNGAYTVPYATVITGFSADGNYVLGQVASHYTCGCAGRGCLHTIYQCTTLTWDLNGNLVSTSTPSSVFPTNLYCPSVPLNQPRDTPPSNSVVGNSFENAGGYTAETIVEQICGSVACPGSWRYNLPTLIAP